MEEIWKDVPGYENIYEVSNLGDVKNKRTNKLLSLTPDKDGYLRLGLSKNRIRKTYSVHRLVAQAFLENPNELPAINHKDENKTNNRVDNLEWCTSEYNNQYSKSRKVNQYTLDGIFLKTYSSLREASRETGCNFESIQGYCSGKYKTNKKFIWKYEDDLSQYELWYIDQHNKAWFTNMWEEQWADDADDVPYEHNAGDPYSEWSELIEDNENPRERKYIHHPILLKCLYFETNDWSEQTPCSNCCNSSYSVKSINNGAIAWLSTNTYSIQAKTTMEEFIKTVKENGGKIYMEV